MKTNQKSFFLIFLCFIILGLLIIYLEKPFGSIAGQISLIREGQFLKTYNIDAKDKIYALAIKQVYGSEPFERGVWIKKDGHFKIDKLPVGEYTLRVKAPNYSTQNIYNLYVTEGKTKIIENISLQALEPWGSIASNTRVFMSAEKPYFWVNASGAQIAIVKIYKTDLLKLKQNKNLELSNELNLYRPAKDPSQLLDEKDLIQTIERKLEPDYTDWARADIKLSKPLPLGDYIIALKIKNINGKNNWNTSWFSVSDLGLIVKADAKQLLIKANNFQTLKALSGISIKVLDKDKIISSIKTNSEGLAIYNFSKPKENYDFIVYADSENGRAYSNMSFWGNTPETYTTYFYTERPVYRLGQTVYYKGIVRKAQADEFIKAQANLPIKIIVNGPDDNKIWSGNLKTSSHGSFNGSIDIPEKGKTGAYQVTITYPDGSESYEYFEIAQYKKPEFKVEVIPLAKQVVAGSKIKVRLKANYYFGNPVKNASIKYSLYSSDDWSTYYNLLPRPDYYTYFDDWDNYEDPYYSGDYLSDGIAYTDENGSAIIEVETQKLNINNNDPDINIINKKYKIQAEVTDLSQSTVTSSAKFLATAGDFILFVQPQNFVYKTEETLSAQINALGFDGQPIKNQEIILKLLYWAPTKKENEYKNKIIKEIKNLKTDSEGKILAQFQLPKNLNTNNYYLQAQAIDSQNNKITDQSSLWIANQKQPLLLSLAEAEKQAFSIKLDKSIYKANEIAKAMIMSPITGKEGIKALITLETNNIREYKIIPLTSSAQLLEIPIKDSYTPNIYLTASFIGAKRQFYTNSEIIKVSPENHFLKILIKTDKQKYKPSETANYTISALYPDGKPAKNIELSLGIIDESIYSIRPETAPNFQKFFYKQKDQLVLTACSFPEQYSGGPDKTEPHLRKDFKDMAGWFPVLMTDAQGIAKASIKLPDNLTSWKATVRGISNNLDLGEATQSIITNQDILIRLALPRFFTQYDKTTISAIVHNYSDKTQKIDLNLKPSEHFEIKEKLQTTLNIPSGEAKKYNWSAKIKQFGEGILQISAVAGKEGDALERKLPINALGLADFIAHAGFIPQNEFETEIQYTLPQSALKPEYNLSLSNGSLGQVLGNFNKLIDYPFGCTEQTVSRLIPSVIAIRLSQTLNLNLLEQDKKKFEEVYKQTLITLKDYQNADGGWGWWKNDSSNLYLTAYTLEGMYLLGSAGYNTDRQITENALKWLEGSTKQIYKEIQSPQRAINKEEEKDYLIDLAQAEYVLNLFGRDNLAHREIKNFWAQNIYGLPTEALAFLALARQDNAYRNLIIKAERSDNFINWDKKEIASYKFTPIEITALALRGIILNNPDNKEIIEKTKNWLLLQRDKDGWQNTKTTAQVLRALAEEEIINQTSNSSSILKVQTNLSPEIIDLLLYDKEKTLNILPKENIKITKLPSEEANGKIYFNSLLSYILPLKPNTKFEQKALPENLKIKRSFYRLEAKKQKDGKIIFITKPLNGFAQAGEIIIMKTIIDSPIRLPYLFIQAPLPSGSEVLERDAKENSIEDWNNLWWTHQDILDDRINYFLSSLPVGKSELNSLIRVELSGTFQLNPVQLEGMYSKKIRAYSDLSELKVNAN